MKQFRSSAFFIILDLILLASPHLVIADQHWHYQASAQVSQPGLVEAVLPAGVFFGTDSAARTSQLDLTLVGPDGNPRSSSFSGKRHRTAREACLVESLHYCRYHSVIVSVEDVLTFLGSYHTDNR